MKSIFRLCLESKLKEVFVGHFDVVVNLGCGVLDYRELIDYDQFVTVDLNKKYNPEIVASVDKTGLPSNSCDLVICTQVLEHAREPKEIVSETLRLLKPNGLCVFSVPFFEVFHGEQDCKDYWRFTHQGLEYLFREFKQIKIEKVGCSSQTLFNFLNKIRPLKVLNPIVLKFGFGERMPMGFVVTARKKEQLNL